MFVSLFFLTLLLQQSQPPTTNFLTNADIVRMSKAGLGEEVIIEVIKHTSGKAFDCSPKALVELKVLGLSDRVIAAMISGTGNSASLIAPTSVKEVVLRDGTEVRMRLKNRITSATAKVDEPVYFEAAEDVKVDDVVVIAASALGRGHVLEVNKKKSFGRRGKLNFSIDVVKTVDGQNVPLRVTRSREGDESYVKTGVVVYLAGPFGALVKGKDVEIEAGSEYVIYINGDRRFSLKK